MLHKSLVSGATFPQLLNNLNVWDDICPVYESKLWSKTLRPGELACISYEQSLLKIKTNMESCLCPATKKWVSSYSNEMQCCVLALHCQALTLFLSLLFFLSVSVKLWGLATACWAKWQKDHLSSTVGTMINSPCKIILPTGDDDVCSGGGGIQNE